MKCFHVEALGLSSLESDGLSGYVGSRLLFIWRSFWFGDFFLASLMVHRRSRKRVKPVPQQRQHWVLHLPRQEGRPRWEALDQPSSLPCPEHQEAAVVAGGNEAPRGTR